MFWRRKRKSKYLVTVETQVESGYRHTTLMVELDSLTMSNLYSEVIRSLDVVYKDVIVLFIQKLDG